MYENILNYFIECVKAQAKQNINIAAEINGHITDKVTPLDADNIKDFFFNRGEHVEAESINIGLDAKLRSFLNSKTNKYSSESLYLTLEFIEKNEFRENATYKVLYPLYFVEVSFTIDTINANFSILDYVPYFNFSLFDNLTENEKIRILEDINNTETWSNKVAIYKDNLPQKTVDSIKQAPRLFIASIPIYDEWLSKEIEFIKNQYDGSINNTALKYFLSQNIIQPPTPNINYIEIFQLNREQENAVKQALSSSFTVITGPPGTGKSQVVLNLLANLYYNGKTVLFASKNNKAVNTVLEKLENLNTYYLPFIRLGNKDEKKIGKQKVLASLHRPNNQNPQTVTNDEIKGIRGEISQIYESIDNILIMFEQFYKSSNMLEEKICDLENYKARYKDEQHIIDILTVIEKTNDKSKIDCDSLTQSYDHFIKAVSKYNKQDLDTGELRKKLNSSLIKIIESKPNLLVPLKGTDNLGLQKFKKETENWIHDEINSFKKKLYKTFKTHYENKYLKRYRDLFSYQDEKIREYFFKYIKNLDFEHYYKAISLFENSLIYSSKIKKLYEQESSLRQEIYPTLLKKFDKLFLGLEEEIKKIVSDTAFVELLKHNQDIFKAVFDYVKLIIEYNHLHKEMKNHHNKILSNDSKNKVDEQLLFLKKQLVEKSGALFSNLLLEKIGNNRPSLIQTINDYYSRWKDVDLLNFFSILKNYYGIWVTTNLSTTYNIPNRPNIFDYVIIDEASQNDIASVIPLLFRAKNAVIIGDPNQLHHITNLKDETICEIANRSHLPPGQLGYFHYEKYSAYDLAKKRYIDSTKKEPIVLRNHYRSYSDIIKFANTIIQDYKLFPKTYIKSNISRANIPIGIHWINVEGVYNNNNTNVTEAEAIIAYLAERRDLLNEISVGIITPFSNQEELIERKLTGAKLKNIGIGGRIMASTVHKFQGDERDVILYSPVISNDILINKPRTLKWANEQTNLLNVAITRARSSLIIFGNMQFCSENDGLHKVLVEYVNSVSQNNMGPDFSQDKGGYERLFYEQLTANGFEFEYQVPVKNGRYVLDFVLKADNHYVNIELDGRKYHLRTKPQDEARDKCTRELGYKVFRFSNEYLRDNLSLVIDSLKRICSVN